eukprot:365618-Chlamydomonas_euryale.AAC.8
MAAGRVASSSLTKSRAKPRAANGAYTHSSAGAVCLSTWVWSMECGTLGAASLSSWVACLNDRVWSMECGALRAMRLSSWVWIIDCDERGADCMSSDVVECGVEC